MELNRLPDASVQIRVAILDTGVNDRHGTIAHALDKKVIQRCHGFPNSLNPRADGDGHGTYVADLLLRTAPDVSLFIARVADDDGQLSEEDDYQEVANVRVPAFKRC